MIKLTCFKKLLNIILLILFSVTLSAQTDLKTKFAINFPFRDPETASFKAYFNLLKDLNNKVIRQLTFGDVFWKQVELINDIWTFSQADSAVANPYGITPIPTLYSMFGEDTVGFQLPWKATKRATGGWTEQDSSDTKDYLSKVINRYKNYTKYWEIGNELSSHDHKPTSFTPADLVPFMKLNYRWIKTIDPQAVIVLPGMLGTCNVPFSTAYTWLRTFLKAGGGNTFDIMNYHDYNSWWTLPVHLDSIKKILGEFGLSKKIWLTESSISSDPTSPITPSYSSTDEQTADTWRRPVVTFANGLDIYFWQALWSSGGTSEWRHFGLTDPTGKKKKSFHSYKLCMDKLDNFTSVQKVSSGTLIDDNNTGGSGLWVYKFSAADGSNKWVLWASPNQNYELSGLTNTKATVTSVNPASISSDGNTVTWSVSVKDVTGGKVTLQLTNMPILVEEGKLTNTAPAAPTAVFPAHAAANIDYNVTLSWNCSDPDGDQLKYNVYMSQTMPPNQKVATELTTTSFKPGELKKNTSYFWKIVAKDASDSTQSQIYRFTTGSTTDISEGNNLPDNYVLLQNYPNPFNPDTKITFGLPEASWVSLKVFDLTGSEITTLLNDYKTAGFHSVRFTMGDKLSSGIYFYRIKAGNYTGDKNNLFTETKKMMLIK